MRIVHVVFHAHLDPIWLWPWTAGLDEALATSRSACDRLDAHPDLFYTQGEAWTFAMVERADPGLFARIRKHVASGQWEIVNGWWTQPDCNAPSAAGMRRQISEGLTWIKDRFGVTPRCGFNPDSFGHSAWLPEIMTECGQDRYLFMRPEKHEKHLDTRLFRWRTHAGGREVTTFRVAGYNDDGRTLDGVHRALGDLPAGIGHTLALYGMGDHGGGPTERIIARVREQFHAIPDVELRFSTVGRFFDAVEAQKSALPVVEGELQMHAIGCYTVMRSMKTALQRAEHALDRVSAIALPEAQSRLGEAWRRVCAHQFHDTLGGTCLPSAYRQVEDELGGAAALAEDELAYALRRTISLADDIRPRVVLANPGAPDFSGWVEIEPYLESRWCGPWRLLDEAGKEVHFQVIEGEALIDPNWWWRKRRVLLRAAIPSGGARILRLDLDAPRTALPARAVGNLDGISAQGGATVRLTAPAELRLPGSAPFGLGLHLIDDRSDTWSHGIDRFGEGGTTPVWSAFQCVDSGPLMASAIQEGTIGGSRLRAEWRVHVDDPSIELVLDVQWMERWKVLKLVLPSAGATTRIDAVLGGPLQRPNDGRELPIQGWTVLPGLAVSCPDVFALDATPERMRLTLLRSPLLAHHDPHSGTAVRSQTADQGSHRFRFRFVAGSVSAADRVTAMATAWLRPPVIIETTKGMGPRDG